MAGALLSANRMFRLVTNSWAGAVYSRRGREGPFFAAMVGATVTTLSYALPWGFWPLLSARMIWGTCWSFLRMGQLLAVLEAACKGERGRWVGRTQAVARIGIIFSLFLGGYLADRIGFTPPVVLFGVVTAVGAGMAWWDFLEARRRQDHHDTDNAGRQAGGYDQASSSFPSGSSTIGPTEALKEVVPATRGQ